MDRITDAIKRARDGNEKAGAASRGGADRRPPPNLASARAAQAREIDFDPDHFARHRILLNENDPVMAAYRVLRTKVLQEMRAHGWRTLAIVSPASGAGKTVTACNLSLALATKSDLRPTLVDLDFYRPSVSRFLGIKDAPSSLDFFEGDASLIDVTVRPRDRNMFIVPNERVTRRGSEYLTGPEIDQMINAIYRDLGSQLIVFDLSPLLGCDDALSFLPKVDCVLLVAASGDTRVRELKEAKRLLGDAQIVGSILNKAPQTLSDRRYYY